MKSSLVKHLIKDKFCFCCGIKENLTVHHIRDFHNKIHKRKGKLNGKIPLCRDCHDITETIINKGKIKKQSYKKGYSEGYNKATADAKIIVKEHIFKTYPNKCDSICGEITLLTEGEVKGK